MSTLRAYLQLLRLPAVFTAMADIFLGFSLTHGRLAPVGQFLLLLGSSSCLYLSGMAFNDIFDREVDARERPSRPIPSGRVSIRSAVALALSLMILGVLLGALVGLPSLAIAGGLALCVLAYDAFLKSTPLGPVAMGSCRFLNVMLGASALPALELVWRMPETWIAGALGLYIVGVTWFARQEAVRSSRLQLAGAIIVVNLGLAALVAWILHDAREGREQFGVLVMMAVVILIVNRRAAAAYFDPAPEKVQPAIRIMLLSLVVLDATLVLFATGSPPLAVAVLSLLIPALFLGRWIYIT